MGKKKAMTFKVTTSQSTHMVAATSKKEAMELADISDEGTVTVERCIETDNGIWINDPDISVFYENGHERRLRIEWYLDD